VGAHLSHHGKYFQFSFGNFELIAETMICLRFSLMPGLRGMASFARSSPAILAEIGGVNVDYEDIVRLNVMKIAGLEGRFSWLQKREQQQMDAAISTVRHGFDADLIRGLESRTEYGFYLLCALETDTDRSREFICYKLAETHVECSKFMTMPAYYQMLTATMKPLKDDKSDVRLFVHALWAETVKLDHSSVLKLLGIGSASYGTKTAEQEFVQGVVLKFFNEMPGHKEFLVNNVSQKALGRLVRKYEMIGLEGVISRKDAGELLSERLGL
jgi:hypothetical protein